MSGGFMSGFGSAFAKSFSDSRQIAAQKEEDLFKMQYTNYLDRRDNNMKVDQENARNVKLSKTLVAQNKQPPEIWPDVYQMLASGMSPEAVDKKLSENQAVLVDTPQDQTAPQAGSGDQASSTPAPADNLTQSAGSAVDSQMRASGMATPPSGGLFPGQGSGSGPSATPPPQAPSMPQAPQAPQVGDHGAPQASQQVPQQAPQGQQAMQAPTPPASVGSSQEAPPGMTPNMGRMSQATGDTPASVQDTMNNPIHSLGDPIPGMEGKSVGWTMKSRGIKPASVNTPGDALAFKIYMDQNGTPEEKKFANNQLDLFNHQEADRQHAIGVANGTAFDFSRAAIKNPKTGKWDNGIALSEPDGNGNLTWKDDHGNNVPPENLKPFTKDMEADIVDQAKEAGSAVQKYNEAVNDFTSMARTAGKLTSLSKQFPQAMGLSGDLSQGFDALKRAGINIASIVNPALNPDGTVIVDQGTLGSLEDAEKAANSMLKGPLDRNSTNALAATLMDIQATKLAYMWAKSMNQQDRSISNQDFKNFKDAAKGNENPEAIGISAADFLSESYKSLKDQETMLSSVNVRAKNFEARFGVPSPFKATGSVDDIINSDPELKKTLEDFSGLAKNNSLTQQKDTSIPSGLKPIGKTPDGKIVYEGSDGKRYVQ